MRSTFVIIPNSDAIDIRQDVLDMSPAESAGLSGEDIGVLIFCAVYFIIALAIFIGYAVWAGKKNRARLICDRAYGEDTPESYWKDQYEYHLARGTLFSIAWPFLICTAVLWIIAWPFKGLWTYWYQRFFYQDETRPGESDS